MSALPRDYAPPPLDEHTEARVAYLVEREVARRVAERSAWVDDILEAVYRACVGIGRTIKPGKRWDGL